MLLRTRNVLFVCCALAFMSCSRSPTRTETVAAAATPSAAPGPIKLPLGRWRLVDPVTLNQVLLWPSHILIRHREAQAGACFSLGDWGSGPAANERSRAEALALIEHLHERALQDPRQFAQLATQYSEDEATRQQGGALGGVQAYQLSPWAAVLDALAQTPNGGISPVVETAYGFHILQLKPPPAEDIVTGARIVIGHDGARFLPMVSQATTVSRTPDEAWALAKELYERALAAPAEFPALGARYSEHMDAAQAGDMGTWSTIEPSNYPREVALLSQLKVGEVAPPIDSRVGIEIIQRTPNPKRDWYAAEQVMMRFEPAQVGQASPEQSAVLAQVQDFARQIQANPRRFSELQREHCCTAPDQWLDGRGPPLLIEALRQVKVGEIWPQPIQVGPSYVVAKRVEPRPPATLATTYALPEPPVPLTEGFIASRAGKVIGAVIGAAIEQTRASLELPAEAAAQLSELVRGASRFEQLEQTEVKLSEYRKTMNEFRELLGPANFARYEAAVNGQWEQIMLRRN